MCSPVPQVIEHLHANNTGLAAFRGTCSTWKRLADATLESLSPKALLPKDLILKFPALKVCASLQHLQAAAGRTAFTFGLGHAKRYVAVVLVVIKPACWGMRMQGRARCFLHADRTAVLLLHML